MMQWEFSDGTMVDLGGKVEGPTVLAQRLRDEIENGATVQVWPHPSEPHALDPRDPALLDAWLRQELDFWTRIRGLDLSLTAPKGVPSLPPPPWAGRTLDKTMMY